MRKLGVKTSKYANTELYTVNSPLYINASSTIFVPEILGKKPSLQETNVDSETKTMELVIDPVVIPNSEEINVTYSNMLYLYEWFINAADYSTDYVSMYDDMYRIHNLLEVDNKAKVKYILDRDILNNYSLTDYNVYNTGELIKDLPNLAKSLFFNMELIYATMYTFIKERILDALSQTLDRDDEDIQHTDLYIYNPLLNYNNKEVGKNVMIKKGLRYDECTDEYEEMGEDVITTNTEEEKISPNCKITLIKYTKGESESGRIFKIFDPRSHNTRRTLLACAYNLYL